MTGYTIFNLSLATIALLAALRFLSSRKQVALVLRVSCTITCITFPWDFVGIQLSTWNYPLSPGLTLVSVPLNDLSLSFLVSVISTSVLVGGLGRRLGLATLRSDH
jgi:hypothetical protein